MPRLSIWNSGRKGADYKFIDRAVSEFFGISGTAAYIHLYLGPHDQTPPPPAGQPPQQPVALDETSIQDVLFLENRDRRYSNEVYELRTLYNVTDTDFDLRQFGLFLTGDTLFLTFHFNDMLALCGRKIMAGDVIELPHRRDDALLDPNAKAINKFYVVEDTSFASEGFSPTWWPHVWRVKVGPMTDSQEYADILDKQAKNPLGFDQGRLGDLMSVIGRENSINEAVVDAAKENFLRRNFETQQFWVVPGDETTNQNPWVFAGDGIPPNGAALVGSGAVFPDAPTEGDYYLRTDYKPHTLFRRQSGRWKIQEIAYRDEWMAAHRFLVDFINGNKDKTATYADGLVLDVKQPISRAIKPRADF
jgi:hypothetical protein